MPLVPSRDSCTIFSICDALRVTSGCMYCIGVPECAVVPITIFTSLSSRAQIWPTCSWRIAPSSTSHSCLLSLSWTSFVSGRPTVFMYHVSGTASMISSAVLLFKQVTSAHWIEYKNGFVRFSEWASSLPGKIALPLDIHAFEKRPLERRAPTSVVTRVPPALCPHSVTDDLLPPKWSIFSCTHWRAAMMSDNP